MGSAVFYGKIVSGRGRSNNDLRELNGLLGENIYPGSLNLVLSEPVFLDTSKAHLVFDNGKRFLWEIKIPGVEKKVFAYRWNGAPLHILELVSFKKLRGVDNKMSIEIENNLIQRTPIFSTFFWHLTWLKREEWYYTNDFYKQIVFKVFKPFVVMASQRNRYVF